jgi:hypothetical protein
MPAISIVEISGEDIFVMLRKAKDYSSTGMMDLYDTGAIDYRSCRQ